jgi:lipoyl(octanoyl) transferase
MFEVHRLGLVPYESTWDKQKELVKQVDEGIVPNQLLLLEHAHTITLGRRSDEENLLFSHEAYRDQGVDVVEIDRGGDVTYHGPGQLVGYPIFFLENLGPRQYIQYLEEVLITTLQHWGIKGERKEAYTGVWVDNEKIAAIGVKFNRGRVKRGNITSHGFALNVNTDLRYFQMIVPCGIQEYGVTSMEKLLGKRVEMEEVMEEVTSAMDKVFFLES